MDELIEAARKARLNAYAPYSVYQVGAAVMGTNGRVYTGCNVENVSYGLTVCAERTAVLKMVSEGCLGVASVAVVTKDGGTPCGQCLQTLLEFTEEPKGVSVACIGEDGTRSDYKLSELLPFGFRSELKKV